MQRPTIANTSWDEARFETCAQRWVHVAEHGFDVGLANDSTYGYDVSRGRSSAGEVTTEIRATIIRAPLFPDPTADRGLHRVRFSFTAGEDLASTIREGYRLNHADRTVSAPISPLVAVRSTSAIVETVKLADDESGDVVLRLYESLGRRTDVHLEPDFAWSSVLAVDLLERKIDDGDPASVDLEAATGEPVTLELRPFQLVTLRFQRA